MIIIKMLPVGALENWGTLLKMAGIPKWLNLFL